MRQLRLVIPALLAFSAQRAAAGPQVWPFQFDPNLAPNPSATMMSLSQGAATLPPLPVSELQTLTTDSGSMTLWFWPENAALLTAIGASGPGLMTWPTQAIKCAQHAAFTMPALDPAAPASCASVLQQLQTQLSSTNLSACLLVEQPERYVTSYSPADVSKDVGNIEDMIGLVGEALTHCGAPAAGLLPSTWVPTMRDIVAKIRYPKLLAQLQQASAAYAQATTLVSANSACFGASSGTVMTTLAGLTAEVTAMTSSLMALEQAGESANATAAQCLGAHARIRNTLAYPGLTDADRQFVAFWLGGLYWRLRGGGLIPLPGTQEARLYYVNDGFGQIGALVGGPDGSGVGTPFVVEVTVDGWSQWQGMGTTGGNDKYTSLIGMTERGQRQAQAGINTLMPLGYDTAPLLTSGLFMGPGYYYAWYSLPSFTYGMMLSTPYRNFMDGPTAIGEFNIGASLGLGLAKTLLPGKPSGMPATDPCSGKACGDDGCGGSCGSCAAGLVCDPSGSCVATGDGGQAADGGALLTDGGAPLSDGSAPVDAAGSRRPTSSHPGCGCAIGAGASPSLAWLPLLLAGALALGRRARRPTASRS
jgi:MYXO-CTERM domain-containing protein